MKNRISRCIKGNVGSSDFGAGLNLETQSLDISASAASLLTILLICRWRVPKLYESAMINRWSIRLRWKD